MRAQITEERERLASPPGAPTVYTDYVVIAWATWSPAG
jgi:hypothetical protein